ncbi:MAG: hypothetical protein K1X75_07465 [Leptospirales bacterium]|nr:hypothetical protein [Leptospirales bacterium]
MIMYPALFQLNTRVRLRALSQQLGRPATLNDIPDQELEALAEAGFDWLWLLSVWQTGSVSREVSRRRLEWRKEFQETLPDLSEEDICGSGFAISDYSVHQALGGAEALLRLRARLRRFGLRLMLDFVPNHMALDHRWSWEHPDFFVSGDATLLAQQPQNYIRLDSSGAGPVFAYGRDPYFDGWPDTLQLDYFNPSLQQAMREVLLSIAELCDGLRCDMAMLVEPEVFQRTWRKNAPPFWSDAIGGVRQRHPDFKFMAEVYWDMEWQLQQHGFDYTYDKRLYDRLLQRQARPVREHLYADLAFQNRSARFMENHDEPRAATAFPAEIWRAAAILSYCSPGLRFFHAGQMEGNRKRISPHLCRGPQETVAPETREFYVQLLSCLRERTLREGNWRLLACNSAYEGNESWQGFIVSSWTLQKSDSFLIAVNYSDQQAQCYVRLESDELREKNWELRDQMGPAVYVRDGSAMNDAGLYLDMPAWSYHVFRLRPVAASGP